LSDSLRFQPNLQVRLVFLSLLFALELVCITAWVDGDAMLHHGGMIGLLGLSGSWVLRCAVTFAASLLILAFLQNSPENHHVRRQVSLQLARGGLIQPRWFAVHLAAFLLFGLIAHVLSGSTLFGSAAGGVALVSMLTGIAAIATGSCAVIPLPCWRSLLWATGRRLWIYALASAMTASALAFYSRALWSSAAQWTFLLVKTILALFVSRVVTDFSRLQIGTETFQVEISSQCSGMEGAALMLGFCAVWLWLLRSEFRFPRALLLAPAGVAILFLLNAVRIAALILIGNAGAPDVAMGGFHSQAGWILFNAVAIAIMLVARRVQWITVSHPSAVAPSPTVAAQNPALPYLLPFLLILAAAMVSRAASAAFEWLYPLRLIASGTALWLLRARYRKLDWHFGWQAPAVGTLVFALWLAGDFLLGLHPQDPLTRSGNPWIVAAQYVWLALRVASSVITVPIAEELAFRGFLIRRILTAGFEQLPATAFTLPSLLISSLAFGVLHGERWIAGTIAGLVYAAIFVRRGRIGDAVAAHATTNGLLAASVLVTGHWNLS
jgi:exosortase E/protease (VPEID-CTERM system)